MTVWQLKGVAVHENAAEEVLKYMRELLDQAEKLQAERDGLVETVGQLSHSRMQCRK